MPRNKKGPLLPGGQLPQVKVLPGALRIAAVTSDPEDIKRINQLRWGYYEEWPQDLTPKGAAELHMEHDDEMAHAIAAYQLDKHGEQLPVASLTLQLVYDLEGLKKNVLKLAGLKKTRLPQEPEPLPFPELARLEHGSAVVVSAKWIATDTFWGNIAVRGAFRAVHMTSIEIVKEFALSQSVDIVGILALHHPNNVRLLERLEGKLHHQVVHVRRAGRMVFRSPHNPDGSTTQRASFLPRSDFDLATAVLAKEAPPAYFSDGYPRLDRRPRTQHALEKKREALATLRRGEDEDDEELRSETRHPTPVPPPAAPDEEPET